MILVNKSPECKCETTIISVIKLALVSNGKLWFAKFNAINKRGEDELSCVYESVNINGYFDGYILYLYTPRL